jgi:hypothetical protein
MIENGNSRAYVVGKLSQELLPAVPEPAPAATPEPSALEASPAPSRAPPAPVSGPEQPDMLEPMLEASEPEEEPADEPTEPPLSPLERARAMMELARQRVRQPRESKAQAKPKPKAEPGIATLHEIRDGCRGALEALEPLKIEAVTQMKHGDRGRYRSINHALAAARRELERALAEAGRGQ